MSVERKLFALLLLAMTPISAHADQTEIQGAQQVVGLFSHTCLLYPMRKEEMRMRLTESGIPYLSNQARDALMHGQLGVGYDASNTISKMALISANNDVCTVIGEYSDSRELIRSLEANLKVVKATINADYKLVDQHDDDLDPSLHHRDYLVTINDTPFNLVASTSDEPDRIQAFLSFGPHTPWNLPMPSESEEVK